GRREYAATWRLQERLRRLRRAGKIPDTLVLVEHPHVYTIGRAGGWEYLLVAREVLEARGVPVLEVDRGGSITYHGPGQLAGYPILDLRRHGFDVHRLLRRYESAISHALARFGVSARTMPGYTGVWVGAAKIAAIGVGVREGVTMHGFALNVDPDLAYFDLIVPCGLRGRSVTSLARELGRPVALEEVMPAVVDSFAAVFDLRPVWRRERGASLRCILPG
ncbi:MAG: lipoyl(octanoyl) transferase LipB, partial [Desulfotomaculales bacterium]